MSTKSAEFTPKGGAPAAASLKAAVLVLCLSWSPLSLLWQPAQAKQKLAAKPAKSVLKPLTPKSATPTGEPSPASSQAAEPADAEADSFPLIGQLEKITFGFSKPHQPIKDRLMVLEAAVFHRSFPHKSLEERSRHLSETLLGPSNTVDSPPVRLSRPFISPPATERPSEAQAATPLSPLETSEYQTERSVDELKAFALEQINQQRNQQGLPPLAWDGIANKVAQEHIDELCTRKVVSHHNLLGDNPDLRYTKAGGTDALSESLITLSGPLFAKNNKSTVASVIQALNSHQDDRDALLSPDATHLGFSFKWNADKQRLLACVEVVTKHGIMHPLPDKITVGQKVEVKGVLLEPYRFQRVTLAWEGQHLQSADSEEDSPDALPYFPPLDFVAYGEKAQRDHQKAITFLKTAGVIAAIAGGMFMPPVALAAPLIAMSGGVDEPHAVSEIPVKGGVKVEGSMFHGNLPVTNEGKEGMYYVTVWAASALDGHPVPISRRIILAASDKPVDPEKQDVEAKTDSGKTSEDSPPAP